MLTHWDSKAECNNIPLLPPLRKHICVQASPRAIKIYFYQPHLICCNLNNTTKHILVKYSRFALQKTWLYWLQYSKYSEIPQILQISKWQNSSLINWTKLNKSWFEYESPYDKVSANTAETKTSKFQGGHRVIQCQY